MAFRGKANSKILSHGVFVSSKCTNSETTCMQQYQRRIVEQNGRPNRRRSGPRPTMQYRLDKGKCRGSFEWCPAAVSIEKPEIGFVEREWSSVRSCPNSYDLCRETQNRLFGTIWRFCFCSPQEGEKRFFLAWCFRVANRFEGFRSARTGTWHWMRFLWLTLARSVRVLTENRPVTSDKVIPQFSKISGFKVTNFRRYSVYFFVYKMCNSGPS